MIADDTEGLPITKGNNVSLCVTFENVEDTKRIYDKFVELGSEILLPFAPKFYTEGYGYVKDEFGIAYHLFTKEKFKKSIYHMLFLIIIYIIGDYQKLWHKIRGSVAKLKSCNIYTEKQKIINTNKTLYC